MKKASPLWLLVGASLILTPLTILLAARASTHADYLPNHASKSASKSASNSASNSASTSPGNVPSNVPANVPLGGRGATAQHPAAPSMTFTVTTPADQGAGSLRTAITQANNNAGLDTIDFNLGAGTPTINVGSITGFSLPAISDPVMINGNTGGATRIELNGTAAGPSAAGLTLTASGCTVRGLVINRFSVHGIVLAGSNNTIQSNFIGTNAAGNAPLPNGGSGIVIGSGAIGNIIGGNSPTAANVISGNASAGVFLSDANGNQIVGNFIGTDTTGTVSLGNGGVGINSLGSSSNNTVGSTVAGSGNTIAFNTFDGIFFANGVGNAILGNSIFSNGILGINLNDDGGVTPNDMCDVDMGANNSQNFPDLTSAQASGGGMTAITGNLNSTPNMVFRIEFFSNTVCNASGNGEGRTFIGSTTVMTPGVGSCDVVISANLAVAVPEGSFITATATDPSNNTSEFSQCVVVTAAACTVTCPANQTRPNDVNQCGASVDYPPPTTDGTCGTVTCAPPAGSFFPVGTTVVTCTSSAGPGCTFQVTVNDTQPPTVTCPADITRGTSSNQCSAVVTYPPPTVSDNCPGSSVSCNPSSGSTFARGTTAVNCTATDVAGNTAICGFLVTVNDTTPPTITCPPDQSATSSVPTVVNYPAPTTSDNCPGVMSSCAPPSGSVFAVGTTTVTCTATDTSANNASCNFTVTVAACTVTCPLDVATTTGPNAPQCGRTVSYPPPEVKGGCGDAVCTPASGLFFPVGSTVVTCTIPTGLTCTFTVTVVDDAPPSITCPNTITTTAAPGQSSAVVNYPAAVATDNCAVASLLCSPPTGARFPVGSTVVTCSATDAFGNSTGCLFTVAVFDQEAPAIICPANVAVGAQPGQTSAVVSYPSPTVADNGAGVMVVCSPASGTSFPLGVTTVTCIATDAVGNKSSCSFTASVGGPLAKVIIPSNKPEVEFGNPSPVSPTRKPLKERKNPCQLFSIQNIGFAPLVLTFDSITRTGSDVDSRKITNPDDTRYFSLSLVGANGSTITIEPDGVVTIQVGATQQFCLRFSAVIPALAGKATGLAAANVLPDTVTSSVNFIQNGGSLLSVKALSHIDTGVIFINPTNPRKPASTAFTRSGNDLTVSYALYDPNLNVSRAKYEFLNSSGQVVGSAFEIDLSEQLGALNLVRGQSFAVEQRFTGATDHPDIVGVRVTVFDGESSVTDSASTASVTTASVKLLDRTGDATFYWPVARHNTTLQ